MPTKKTTKSDSKTSKVSEKKAVLKAEDKKTSIKKVVVKRRKIDLKPTRASAVAIASQANRAKKQALIEKLSNSEIPAKNVKSSDTKIPLWVRIFFWCSLFLFCISFYKAIICPQLSKSVDTIDIEEMVNVGENEVKVSDELQESDEWYESDLEISQDYYQDEMIVPSTPETLRIPETSMEVINEYFVRLSNHQFNEAFDLMVPVLRRSSEIRDHFSSFRMDPFLDWIEWWRLTPINFEYVNSPAYWRDVYKFDLSYVLNTDQSRYDEEWEFTVNTSWDEPKISSIRCVTSKCSRHPIFWPENFGLMK